MKSFLLKIVMPSVLISALVGCSIPVEKTPTDDPITASIKAIISRSSDSPAYTASSQAKPVPPALGGATFTMTYAGDAAVFLTKIAAANKLHFAVLGPQPHLPLFVTVNVTDVPLEVLLRDVGEQFGQRARLALTDRAIEIRYNDVNGRR